MKLGQWSWQSSNAPGSIGSLAQNTLLKVALLRLYKIYIYMDDRVQYGHSKTRYRIRCYYNNYYYCF